MEAVTAPAARARARRRWPTWPAWPPSKHGDKPALRHKVGDEWAGRQLRRARRGRQRDRPRPDRPRPRARRQGRDPRPTPAPSGPTPTSAILAAGAVSVSVYQTNSAGGVPLRARALRVEGGVRRGRRAAGEDPRRSQDELPNLEHIVVFDPVDGDIGDAISLDDLRERGRGRDAAELERAHRRGRPRTTSAIYIYTSGTTGPPKGCMLTPRQLPRRHLDDRVDGRARGGRGRLPLPPARARVREADPVRGDRPRRRARLLGEGPAEDHPQPDGDQADVLPVGAADVREDLHAGHLERAPDPEQLEQAVQVGAEGAPDAGSAGEEVPAELQAGFDQAEEALYKNVRGIFGGNIRQCVTGAAPIAKEILEFFYACGVPVMEGYGMTETSTVATANTPEDFRFGSVGKPHARRGGEGRPRTASCCCAAPNIFQGYYKNEEATERDARGRLAAHRRPRLRSTTTASCSSPAARRTSSSPRAARTSRRPTWRTASSRTAGSRRPWWSATAARTWSR